MSKPGSGPRRRTPKAPEITMQMPVDETDVDKLRRYHTELGDFIAKLDAERNPVETISRHFRRHLPLYAFGAILALIVVLVPTTNERNASQVEASSLTNPDNNPSATADTTQGQLPGTSRRATVGGGTGPQSGALPGSVAPQAAGISKVAVGTGKTIGGYDCKPGVRQIPWSVYAAPCVAKFTGNNGGKTYRGVDAKTITITIRKNAVDAGDATDTQNAAQGRATRAQAMDLLNKWSGYFAKTMDLYGRKLKFVRFNSKVSNGVDEAQSKNQDGACNDATNIASSGAFGDIGYATSFIETQPFSACAKQKQIFVPFGASYFPEYGVKDSFVNWDPYVWNVYMECVRITRDVAEYLGKRLVFRKAKWAKDPNYQTRTRKLGVYVPDNPGYQYCVNNSRDILRKKYHADYGSRFDYQLDVSRFPEQAARAVIQFKRDGVTTLVNACDTISTRFLTEAANNQQWGPEWFIIGVATQDTDGAAQTFNQSAVDGHLFGMSQFGQIRLIEGKAGEAYKTWKIAFPKETPPTGFGDAYYRILLMYTMFQVAGPDLTPENIARGLHALPDMGGAHGAFGTWSFKGDHTATDDSREIYWTDSVKGYNGKPGAYIETYGGKRFRSGQWPAGEPPVYPKK